MTARELVRRIQNREVSAVEVLQAHLEQIDRVNPVVNAIVTLLPERAMAAARAADAALGRGDDVGPLHGLPIAHKDTLATKGIRTPRDHRSTLMPSRRRMPSSSSEFRAPGRF